MDKTEIDQHVSPSKKIRVIPELDACHFYHGLGLAAEPQKIAQYYNVLFQGIANEHWAKSELVRPTDERETGRSTLQAIAGSDELFKHEPLEDDGSPAKEPATV